MAHTPGPWTLDWTRGNKRGRIKAGGRTVCSFHSSAPTLTREQDEANARLIATAPELLAAIVNYLDWGAMTGSDRDLFARKFGKLIAKAEGRP
jgi:hypothetical protein